MPLRAPASLNRRPAACFAAAALPGFYPVSHSRATVAGELRAARPRPHIHRFVCELRKLEDKRRFPRDSRFDQETEIRKRNRRRWTLPAPPCPRNPRRGGRNGRNGRSNSISFVTLLQMALAFFRMFTGICRIPTIEWQHFSFIFPEHTPIYIARFFHPGYDIIRVYSLLILCVSQFCHHLYPLTPCITIIIAIVT